MEPPKFGRKFTSRLMVGIAAVVLVFGAAACGGESAGPEQGADVEDIQNQVQSLEEDIGALEERVGALEDEIGAQEGAAADEDAAVFEDPQSFVGQQVTVSARVTEVFVPPAFNLSGDDVGGEPLLVIQATGPTSVDQGQTVKVTGTVRVIETGFFGDIGFEPDEEFFSGFGVDDAAGFVSEFEGEHVIVADQVQVIQSDDA